MRNYSIQEFSGRGIVRSGNCPVGKLSGREIVRSRNSPVGKLSGREIVRSGNGPVGKWSGREMVRSRNGPVEKWSGREMVRSRNCPVGKWSGREIVRSGNCPVGKLSGRGIVRSGNCPVGELSGRGIVRSGNCPTTLKKKTETITLNLPSKCTPTNLAGTCPTTKTSSRNEVRIVSTLFKAGGADMNEASLSVSTIRRQRKAAVQSHAKELRSTFAAFKQFQDTFLVLHWDGKIIQLMDGKTEDRLAIAVSSFCNLSGQFIASPAIAEGTGDTMAKCVFKIMNDFELIESVGALVFDTTASNTGQWRGSARLFEVMLQRSLLWLACRHHIPEPYTRTCQYRYSWSIEGSG